MQTRRPSPRSPAPPPIHSLKKGSEMKFFVTKYALTDGIIECEGEICSDVSEKMIAVKNKHHFPDKTHYHKPYWHVTRSGAAAHAEELRVKKIASLRKQIAKLEKLTF
jgi:hypothetical protein